MSSKPQTKPRCPSNGTVVITGANGSLALMFVENLLRKYPSYHAILAVRDASDDDQNTIRLREIVNNAMNDKVSIEAVDLASLSSVRNFADSVFGRVSTQKLPPISAVVCNAFNWSLTGQQNSPDGFDLCFEVSHLSHFVLVLKLLGSMDKASGRVVLLGSDAHYTDRTNAARKLGSAIPENIEELIRPTSDKPGTEFDRGFQRYGTAKLASIMFMHMLNRKLLQVRSVLCTALNPLSSLQLVAFVTLT
jgi:WW domain-containing oxidoreductase